MRVTIILAAALIASTALAAPRQDGLARDLDRVESVRAIKALQHGIALEVEAGRWKDAAAHFTPDAQAEWGDGKPSSGAKAIETHLRRLLGDGRDGRMPGSVHAQLLMAPVVTLADDGEHAKARWHVIAMLGGTSGTPRWNGGIYENDYIRVNGAWRIARMNFYPQLHGPYAGGWRDAYPDQKVFPYHYDAATVGRPATSGPAPSPLTANVARRITALIDSDAIANLQNAYGYYVDRKMWGDVADLFEANATYSIDGTPEARGAAAIRAALERADGPAGLRHSELNDHVQIDMLVCVAPDGVHARTRGIDLGMTGRNDGRAYWSLSLFDNRFVKAGGVWQIAAMRLIPRMKADYATGWGKGDLIGNTATGELPLFSCGSAPAAPLSMTGEEAEAQLRRAAARDAIENVSGAFGNYIDDFAWEDLGRLFTATGRREAPGVGFYVGPVRVTKMEQVRYGSLKSPRTFVPIHARIQPVIDVAADGRSAKYRTRLLQLNTALDRPGGITTAMYEDEMVLDGGAWKFKSVEVDHQMQTLDIAKGWTGIPDGSGLRLLPPADSLLRTFPPDTPIEGEMYPPFPTIGIMWFHYANPVSGRKPAYMTPKSAAVVSSRDVPSDQ
ncbi:nuclear transport factor 2 family protein [Sphingomonas sp. MMS24-J13]|uniref:nuclear transport factor 2 family protein n=1 Tax=Sphingomonas sp. MMS24-J13 TaxID=3238686 RepID=UPI00385026B8